MATGLNHLCPGCMRELNGKEKNGQKQGTRCPFCGFSISDYKQNPRCLPLNTILAGKYLVGRVLGEGGFGITYMGYDLNMKTRIAIKEYFPVELVSRDTTRLTEGGGSDRVISLSGEKSKTYQQGLKKYVDEARNVSQFSGTPGIVSVKDFFYENDTAYIVMEYIEGVSLKEYLKQKGGRLSEEEALAILRPVLEALEQVHGAGIVHRDISPDNIMLTFAGEGGAIAAVRLIDFGAARMTAKNDQKSLTIILKHGYAPEEQYRSHGEQGPWTDVYALCAVLYRMLTGKVPEPAMDRLFSDSLKRPEELGAAVSPMVSEAIMRGLAVKKDGRIQTVKELTDALYGGKKLKKNRKGGPAGAAFRKQYGKWIAAASGIAAALVVGIFAIIGLGDRERLSGAGASGAEAENAETVETSGVSQSHPLFEETAKDGTADGGEAAEDSEDPDEISLSLPAEELGEQIAFYHPQNSMSTWHHTLICKPDGTVEARGRNENGQCDVQDWENIVSVKAGGMHSLGLRSDGKVVAAGDNSYGQCDVTHWADVVQICTGEWLSLGVTKDGKVLIAGEIHQDIDLTGVGRWEGIKRVALQKPNHIIWGLKYDGTIVAEGSDGLEGWEDADDIEEFFFQNPPYLIGLKKDGTLRSVALGEVPPSGSPFADLPKMKQIYAGALGVTIDGTVTGAEESIGDETAVQEIQSWSGLTALAYVDNAVIYGLKNDGSLLEYYINQGNAFLEDFQELEWAQLTGISYSSVTGLLAQKKNGEILYFGSASFLQELVEMAGPEEKLQSFLVDMGSSPSFLTQDGRFVFADYDEHSAPMYGVRQAIQVGEAFVLLLEDGSVRIYGRELDFSEEEKQYVESWQGIVSICGDNDWIGGLKADGTVIFSNGYEVKTDGIQAVYGSDVNCLGLREDGTVAILQESFRDAMGNMLIESWTDVKQLAMGNSHTVGLREDGTVVAAGSNHEGQCDVEDWRDIVYIDARNQCTIGITKDGRLMLAGTFY